MKAFNDKGRLSFLLHDMPVFAVMDQGLGQRGAHYVAVKLLQKALQQQTMTKSTSVVKDDAGQEEKAEVPDATSPPPKAPPLPVSSNTSFNVAAFTAGFLTACLVGVMVSRRK